MVNPPPPPPLQSRYSGNSISPSLSPRRILETISSGNSSGSSTRSTTTTGTHGRGRGSSVQSRRTAAALGFSLGSAMDTNLSSPRERSESQPHSRQNSGTFYSPTSLFPPTISTGAVSTSTSILVDTNGADGSSRRASISNLSFLTGIEHHTRVRAGQTGRGVSRSASRSTSRAGHDREEDGRRRGSFDGERILFGDDWDQESSGRSDSEEESDDDEEEAGQRKRSTSFGSRGSSVASISRRPSIVFPSIAVPNFQRDSVGDKLWEEEEGDYPFGTTPSAHNLSSTVTTAGFMKEQSTRHVFQPPTRSYPADEEPYLETAPSSPTPLNYSNPDYSNDYSQNYRRYSSHYEDGLAPSSLTDVDVFEVGERIGVGVWLENRGGWVRDCFSSEEGELEIGVGGGGEGLLDAPTECEVVSRLGEGTYAIVYLVREVLSGPASEDVEEPLSPLSVTNFFPPASASSEQRPLFHSWSSDPFEPPAEPVYGRSFALKCLCKKDLSEDLVAIQREEAVLHRALPEHEFIVRLFGAYETDDWLFLVLEYCPGQDLFYWLDERQDSSMALYGDFHSRATSPFQGHIPPSPSRPKPIELVRNCDEEEDFLSRTITKISNGADLMTSAASSRRNVSGESDRTPPSPSLLASTENSSLLSRKRLRLISRMFGQMCSALQICHENGVAHRDIKPENFIVMDGRGEGGLDGERGRGRGRVVVKITDWGLGTREDMCEDFDCGSKPYMAYECRNNLEPTYNPRQADVWSLGLVLLNLLYHRNPWADPSLNDPDFAAYVESPIEFLQDRFEGIGLEVATFLTNRVFCDILEIDDDTGEMRRRVSAGEFGKWSEGLVGMMGEGNRKRASVSEHTFQLTSDLIRPLPITKSPQNVSLLTQYAPITSLSPVEISLEENGNETLQPSLFLSTDTPIRFGNGRTYSNEDDSLPSPSFPPFKSDLTASIDSIPVSPLRSFALDRASPSPSPLGTPNDLSPAVSPLPTPAVLIPPRRSSLESSTLEESLRNGSPGLTNGFSDLVIAESAENGVVENEAAVAKARRRKRGARKGKAARAASELSSTVTSPTSPLNGTDSNRDKILLDLASASQDLAREVSRATRAFGTHSAGALPSSSTYKPIITSPAKKTGVFNRMKNLVSDGNPDLQAFKLKAQERDGASDVISAPAKLQGNSRNRTNGEHSWGSVDGEKEGVDHWGSSSSRRERLEARKHPTPALSHVIKNSDGNDWRAPSMNRNASAATVIPDKPRTYPSTPTKPHIATPPKPKLNPSIPVNLESPVNGSPATLLFASKDGPSSKNGNKLGRMLQKYLQ